MMAPCLKLPKNFNVRTFGSSWNSNGNKKYMMPFPEFNSPSVNPIPGAAHVGRAQDFIHVSKTRLLESLLRPAPRDCPTSESIVESDERPDLESEVLSDGGKATRKRMAAEGKATAAPKRRRTASKTMTKCWQEVWSHQFTWVEGEFDAKGNLTNIVCQSYIAINGRKRVLVPKRNKLKKHEGKCTCKEDGVSLPNFKKGDVYMKLDCKYNKFCKLWAGCK